jgi:hypothetical protein
MEIKVAEIYAFKMTSGQEIVAKVESIDDEYYHVATPLTIGQGQQGMEFLQAMFCAKIMEDSAMLKTSVSMVAPVRDDVKEAYEASINPSEIITPGKKQIIHS